MAKFRSDSTSSPRGPQAASRVPSGGFSPGRTLGPVVTGAVVLGSGDVEWLGGV